jgi:4-cresol dehydrogenase (hydroxylating)
MSNTKSPARPIGDIDTALVAFTDLLGEDAVISDLDKLLEFRDPFTYRESDQWDASAVVMPTTTEQVSAVVKIANEYGVPLWTFSQGRNNTYGGPAPRVPGSVIVNLRNMNRVLEVNDELAYAVVEPGVRWFDLFDALEAAGGRLWTSIPDLGWGSVVGNSSEYGRGYTPYGDHAENICGLEVVLPTGEIVRTGMGAMIGSQSAHIYKHAFGPQLQGLFQSSGLGIITQMGYWLQRRPEAYASCWLSFRGDEALAASIDLMRELMLDGTVTNYPGRVARRRTRCQRQPELLARTGPVAGSVRALRPSRDRGRALGGLRAPVRCCSGSVVAPQGLRRRRPYEPRRSRRPRDGWHPRHGHP